MNYIYSGRMVFDCMKLVNELTGRAPGGLDEEAIINGKRALAIWQSRHTTKIGAKTCERER